MSKREWKPGDVAMSHDERVFMDLSHEWRWVETRRTCLDQPPYGLRPLVVIDPEDEDILRQIGDLLIAEARGYDDDSWLDLQAALREFANPTPPRPDEPMGLGAVVEDAAGRKWVRSDTDGIPWHRAGATDNDWRQWPSVDAVRVLAEGVVA